MQGGEFNKIIEDIEKAENNVKKDIFAKKYALIICNADYQTKSGLPDLEQTRNDLKNIKVTA